jgi:hypothetical protein
MTKEIRKKSARDWVVFIIWALTALFLLYDAHAAYRNIDSLIDRYVGDVAVSADNSVIDSVSIMIGEETDSGITHYQEDRAKTLERYEHERTDEQTRLIIIALYAVIAGCIFLAVKGRSNAMTLIYVLLVLANIYLTFAHEWLVYR